MNSYGLVECDGGAVGFTENPAALKRYSLVEFVSHIEYRSDIKLYYSTYIIFLPHNSTLK